MYHGPSAEFYDNSAAPSNAPVQPPWLTGAVFPEPSPSLLSPSVPSSLATPNLSPLCSAFSSPSPHCPMFSPSLTPSPNPTEPFPYPISPYPMMAPSPQYCMPAAAPFPFADAVPYPIVPPLPSRLDTSERRLKRDPRRRSDDSRKDAKKRRRKSPVATTKPFNPRVPLRRHRRESETPSSTSIGKLIAELAALDKMTSANSVAQPPLPRSVRPRALRLHPRYIASLSGRSFFRRHQGPRPPADTYDDGGWDVCALNACVPVTLIVACVLLILLGTANRLLQVVSNEFPFAAAAPRRQVAGGGSGGSAPHSMGLPLAPGAFPTPPPLGARRTRSDCATDSCLWEGQYLLGKINYNVPPCQDFYAHVCSDNWFKDNRNFNSHPFAYRATSAIMSDLWKLLQRQSINESTFASHAAIILRRCVPSPSKEAPDWTVLRKILADLGIDEWPYVDALPNADTYDIAKVADKMLGVSTVVTMSVRERPVDREIVLHLDAPPILLRRHEDIFPGEDLKAYEAFVARVLSLLKPAGSSMRNLVLEIVRLEQRLSDAAANSMRSVPVLHVVRPLMQVRSYPHWNWNLYFAYFLQGTEGRHSNTKIVLLDAAYFDRLPTILSQASSRILANYIGYKLLVHLSPLLPSKAAEFMVPLSHQYHSAGGVPPRIEACMYLLERLYPYGTSVLVWSTIFHKLPGLLSGSFTQDLSHLEQLARFEMRQSAATAPWLSQDEADVAVLKVERLRVVLVPGYRDLELHYPLIEQPSVILSPTEKTAALETFYNLMRTLRAQYWSTTNLTWFRQPLLPTESVFQVGFSYDPSLNLVSVSPTTVAFVVGISRRLDHTAVPFLLGQLLRGMFSVMDVRGSTVDADKEFRTWWSSTSEDRFLGRARCLQGSFGAAARRFIKDGLATSAFLEENVMDGALLRPLYNIYSRIVKKGEESAAIAGQPRSMTLRRLFFVNWATTMCEPPQAADVSRKRLRHKISVPARLRVNVALSRFLPFAEAFVCPSGTRMNPARSCSFW